MNLNYALSDIAHWIGAEIIGDPEIIINKVSFDSRSPLNTEQTLFFALKGQKGDGHQFVSHFIENGGSVVVVEQEQPVNCTQLLVKNSLTALQLLAKHHRSRFNIPVIGITGSNGKTTVKEWLYHTLKDHFKIIRSPKSYNSQIGVPLSILEINEDHQLAIIEAGISQPGEMEKLETIIKPTIGVYTGIGLAHQINFSSIEEKESEKMILFREVEILFSEKNLDHKLSIQIPFNDSASIINAGLVQVVAKHLNLDAHTIANSLSTLPYISMRMEKMEGSNGNILINDAYSFDEKGFEIALKAMQFYHENQKRVVVLAPDSGYTPGVTLLEMINANRIDTLVWIHSNPFKFETKTTVKHFSTVDQFIQNPLSFKDAIILFSGSRTMKLERSIPFYQLKKHVTRLEIDLNIIRKNLNYYRGKLKTNTKVLAMVKAQSYGSGSIEMARFLASEKVNALGVAYADEGVALRKEGIQLPILVMNPEREAFDDIIDHHLEPSIYSLRILDRFLHQIILKNKKRVPIHIKLDTGMHRLGFVPDDIEELIAILNAQPEVYVTGVFSHLAAADDLNESDFTRSQIHLFEKMCNRLEEGIGYPFVKHISNSDGTDNFPEGHFDMVRIGIGLFGLSGNQTGDLSSAISFKTQVSQLKEILPGETIGYGRRFKVEKKMKLGILPVGYADGLSRALGNMQWFVKVNSKFAPIIGSICMDMCMVDLTGVDCQEGNMVEVFGWENSIFEMADKLDTISYEIISTISNRVHRVYID